MEHEELESMFVEADQVMVDHKPTIQEELESKFVEADQVMADHKPTIDYMRLTSFLEFDDSFLTPWNWNPSGPSTSDSKSSVETTSQDYVMFQPGLFFTRGYEGELVAVRDDDHDQYTYSNEFTAMILRGCDLE
ncbi:hypothetical protein D8674_006567 [Pyrus ussuriensis x Pyrus communis]|uniref:Uncharacterized protein n=1 Tax=Pyrus ussuriensis x Pyrus communis TaxID=2448454 RepID=A0A5N5FZI6_9ROSA|nr:hypothetical protein D8674_006567 [Pyrus ussuriensis x Pyrus communis]